ncbi:bacteriocin [Acuticoccus sp. M5D2P5]|uniref:bacteriocin n=1 Tax=Acuticoccus kalidii TaxID=2910977 RepID=UPI001F47AF37|nr:bacteriocin [Acuticoccus kalidii]MCF3933186.1 bacteriocin [Acuticoccus kalidii]
MKKVLLAMAMVAGLAACNSNSQTDRALVGGAVGGGTGALIAAAAGANPGTTLGVAAASAAGGALVGAATAPRNCVNQYGEPVVCP